MKKSIKLFAIIGILTLAFNTGSFVYGISGYNPIDDEIDQLNSDIQSKKKNIQSIQEKQKAYENAIRQAQSQQSSLSNQLAILDNRLAKAELDLEAVQAEVDKTNLEMQKTNLSIEEQNKKIDTEHSHIEDIIKLIDKQDKVSTLEVLLLNDSFGEFLAQTKNLEDLNGEVSTSLENLKKYKEYLETEQKSLNTQKDKLAKLNDELKKKKDGMETEKSNKAYTLVQLDVTEKQYQNLLAKTKAEQQQAAADIVSMERAMRAKLASKEKLEMNPNGLVWPVTKNVITSYFHDPDYPFKYIFEHPAIDIRAGQGTPLKAAASGYVARAKYGSKGSYGYIMIVHGDGLSTVYGHASKIYVKEDDYVVQGQVIGASGGMPGADGSGPLTTGPHLHFEVRLNGIPVDPLAYLP